MAGEDDINPAALGALSMLGSDDMAGGEGDEALGYAAPSSMRPELRQMYERGAKLAGDVDTNLTEVTKRQRAAVEAKRSAIQRGREALLGRQPDNIEILLALAKGFGSPTKTGSFAETLGNVAGEALPAVSRLNAARDARDQRLLQYDTEMAGVEGDASKIEYDQLMKRLESARKMQTDAQKIASSEQRDKEKLEARKQMTRLVASLKQSGSQWKPLDKLIDVDEKEAARLTEMYGVKINPGPTLFAMDPKSLRMVPLGNVKDKVSKPLTLDLGTEVHLIDRETGEVISKHTKDIKGAAAQRSQGTAEGQEAAKAPASLESAERMLASIDSLANDKALPTITGWTGAAISKVGGIPGGGSKRALGIQEQIKGQAFLQAFESLRGGGAITEVEGTKATNAIMRLNNGLSEKDYRDALNELREVVSSAIEHLKAKKGGGGRGGAGAGAGGAGAGGAGAGGAGWSVREVK
jgi:hypothetical protein